MVGQKQMSGGKCSLCNATFSKSTITGHLKSCLQVKASPEKQGLQKAFHIVVEGRYLPEYWLHLSIPFQATLKDLDKFLRNIWLECCGHLSSFDIEGKEYATDKGGMKESLAKIFRPGLKFDYAYDFGSTTDLSLQVISEIERVSERKSITILARNNPPLRLCGDCGKPATQICTQCIYEGKGWLCDDCATRHKCGKDMLSPVVNSPRVGICGYTG